MIYWLLGSGIGIFYSPLMERSSVDHVPSFSFLSSSICLVLGQWELMLLTLDKNFLFCFERVGTIIPTSGEPPTY